MFPVSEAKARDLAARMAALGLREADLLESFVHSRGPGGQHVNKTATCVVLQHPSSGLRVKCQDTRSQGLNRFLARRRLVEQLEARRDGAASAERARREKLRRQKRRRSARARAKLVALKRRHGDLKAGRRQVDGGED